MSKLHKAISIASILALASVGVGSVVVAPVAQAALRGNGGGAPIMDDQGDCAVTTTGGIGVIAGSSLVSYVGGEYGTPPDPTPPDYNPSNYYDGSVQGSIEARVVSGPISLTVVNPPYADSFGNVTQGIAVQGLSVGTATIEIDYSANAEDESGGGGDICDATQDIQVTVAPSASMTIWDNSNPDIQPSLPDPYAQKSLGYEPTPSDYILQSGGGSSGIGDPNGAYAPSGQNPVLSGYVVCGFHYVGPDGNDHLRTEPIACPIDPEATAAGFSWATVGSGAGTPSEHGSDCAPQSPLMDGVYQWNNNDTENIACGALSGNGALAIAGNGTPSSPPGYMLVEVTPSDGENFFCPDDSVVVGGYYAGYNAGSNSMGEFGCAQVLFPQSSAPPPPPSSTTMNVTLTAIPTSTMLGATTTLSWNAVESTSTSGGTSFNANASPSKSLAFMNVAHADATLTSTTSSIQCGFTGGSNASGSLPSSGLSYNGSYVVTPASAGVQTYSMTCNDGQGDQANATTTITVIPPGTITVASFNSVTDAGVTSTWTFTAPSDSSLNNCNAASDPACAGTSATYSSQPSGAIYTIAPLSTPVGYSFDSAASNGGYNADDPTSQTLQPGATDAFNLVWDPIAAMNVALPSLALTASSPSGQVTITNNGTGGSTLSGVTASVPAADSAWLSVGDTSGVSLGAGGSANVTITADASAAPSDCSSSGGCPVTITFTGNSSPGAASLSGAVAATYYGTATPPPCTGAGCNASALIGASSTEVSLGSSTTLTWSSTNASACSASSDSSGAGDLSSISGTSGSQPVTPTTVGTKHYTIDCPSSYANLGGTPGVDTVSVSVTQGSTTCEIAGDCPSPPAQVNLTLASTTIASGSATTLSWTTLYAAQTCTASGAWSGNEPNEGSTTVAQAGTYTLTCPAADGTDASGADSAMLTVNPSGGEGGGSTSTVNVSMAPSSQQIQVGNSASFSWFAASAPNEPLACTAVSSPAENDGWNGASEPAASSTSVTPDALGAHTYTLTCTNTDGASGSGNVTVDVDSVQDCETSGDCNGGGAPYVTMTPQTQTIAPGGTATITWSSSNANGCTASAGTASWPGAKEAQGSQSFVLQNVGTYHYDLYCSDAAGATSTTETATVQVAEQNPVTASLLSNGYPESTIQRGDAVTLTWTTTNANACVASTAPSTGGGSWSGSEPTSDAEGQTVTPTVTGTYAYALSCTGAGGSASASTTVNVLPNPPACSFGASPSSITAGAASNLAWSCNAGAASCTLDGAAVNPAGGESVSPTVTTTYTLSCTGQDGSFVATTTVAVGAPGLREGNP